VRPEVTNHRAPFMGRLADDKQMHLSLVLPLRNQAALTDLLQRLYDPSSPDYRHFLTVAQFTEQFGPNEQDYAAVAAYLQSQGLTVEVAPANRLVVPVSGSVAQINSALKLQMSSYQHPTENRTFFSPDREPSLPLNLRVRHITGLDNFSQPHHVAQRANAGQQGAAVNGSGPNNSYLGSDMRAAYYGGTTLDGTGQAIGLIEFGGYDTTDVSLTFTNAGQTTNVPVNNVLLDGATGGTVGEDSEQVLDIVQAIGVAPGLSQVRVYIGIGQDDASLLNSMASENIAKQLSCSWGWLPADPATDDVFFQEMAAQGQSFFAASGDSGAFAAAISPFFYPADDQYVTAVGGTHLTTSGPGGTWVSETVWNSVGGGSGGGISQDGITLPSYQNGLANSANGGSTTLRNVPDVAMEGDFDNYACEAHACSGNWAGTSFAAPRWAGFMALVNQQAVEAGNAPWEASGF
jgi:subtilase family serine protease